MRNKLLRGYEWLIDNNSYWFLLEDTPAICRLDGDYKVVFLKKIPASICSQEFAAYHKCIKINQYLYCLPDWSKSIIRYDIDEDVFAVLNLDGPGRIFDYFISGKSLYLYASFPRRMIIIDLDNFRIVKEIYALENNINNYFLGMRVYEDGAWCTTGILKEMDYFDFNTNEFKKIIVDIDEPAIGLDIYNGQLFIYGLKGIIYHYEIGKNGLKAIDKISITNKFQFDWNVQLLNKSVFYDNKIFTVSWACNYLSCYDMSSHKVEYIEIEGKSQIYNPRDPGKLFFDYLSIQEKNLIVRNDSINTIYSIDLESFNKSEVEIMYTIDDIKKAYNGITINEDIIGLNDFIRMI